MFCLGGVLRPKKTKIFENSLDPTFEVLDFRQQIEYKQKSHRSKDVATNSPNTHCLHFNEAIFCNLSDNYRTLVDIMSELSQSNALRVCTEFNLSDLIVMRSTFSS